MVRKACNLLPAFVCTFLPRWKKIAHKEAFSGQMGRFTRLGRAEKQHGTVKSQSSNDKARIDALVIPAPCRRQEGSYDGEASVAFGHVADSYITAA